MYREIKIQPFQFKSPYLIFLMAIMGVFMSCSGTRITSSWRDPYTHIHEGDLKKILVVAWMSDSTSCRIAEDEMVHYLGGVGVPSYRYLPVHKIKWNTAEGNQKLKDDRFDAAITLRLIEVDKEKIYTPRQQAHYPEYYRDFGRYYYRNQMYRNVEPAYVVSQKFRVETILYSIEDDQMIWSGITATYDPENVQKLTREIAGVIHKQMIQEKFIEPESSTK